MKKQKSATHSIILRPKFNINISNNAKGMNLQIRTSRFFFNFIWSALAKNTA